MPIRNKKKTSKRTRSFKIKGGMHGKSAGTSPDKLTVGKKGDGGGTPGGGPLTLVESCCSFLAKNLEQLPEALEQLPEDLAVEVLWCKISDLIKEIETLKKENKELTQNVVRLENVVRRKRRENDSNLDDT